MTIIIKYDKDGNPIYKSYRGVGSTSEERQKANQLDELAKNKIKRFIDEYINNDTGIRIPGTHLYWHFGNMLRNIVYESELVLTSELDLFFQNAALYTPEYIKGVDRSQSRSHFLYCFRLGHYDYNKAINIKWGEWVFLFDSPKINNEIRFDIWFSAFMEREIKIDRQKIRLMVKILNSTLNNIETGDLNDQQLFISYESVWDCVKPIIDIGHKLSGSTFNNALSMAIKSNVNDFGEVLEGTISPHEYSVRIVSALKSSLGSDD